MYNVSFRATPAEINSIRKACDKLSQKDCKDKKIKLVLETAGDQAYITNELNGKERVVRLNIETTDGFARTTLQRSTDYSCRQYFSKRSTVEKIADTFDRLKYLMKRAKEKENTSDY